MSDNKARLFVRAYPIFLPNGSMNSNGRYWWAEEVDLSAQAGSEETQIKVINELKGGEETFRLLSGAAAPTQTQNDADLNKAREQEEVLQDREGEEGLSEEAEETVDGGRQTADGDTEEEVSEAKEVDVEQLETELEEVFSQAAEEEVVESADTTVEAINDDLTKIKGIGAKTQEILIQEGLSLIHI